ncbi:MAG: hypothetical protein DRI75_07855 [Bacteroidetes bacterium]|nr:MAG: hypothetical protein DRI75_07855 [Bacteroidota bacterium]
MKRIILILFLIIFLVTCSNKIVQLPETYNSNITEITDVSAVYLFYDETKKDSVELNRKNLIGTTNWLFNVDKRLTLKQVIPSIVFLQNKKRNAELHKNESAKNYFTCSNPEIQNLAFIEFTDVVYHEESLEESISKNYNFIFSENSITINFNLNNEITILNPNTNQIILKTEADYLFIKIEQVITLENIIYLSYNKNLSFQDYISYKSLLLELELDNVIIDNNEFIYN